jgi:hypothetical protein
MDDIDLDKVLRDLEEIRINNEMHMTREERESRLEERKKEKEKVEGVNKLNVDPFPECIPMREKLLRELEEKKRRFASETLSFVFIIVVNREVAEWQQSMKEQEKAYECWFTDTETLIKSTQFGTTSDEIKVPFFSFLFSYP